MTGEKVRNGMLLASEFFKSFYKLGFFLLIVMNTMVSILFFYVLATIYPDSKIVDMSILAIKIIYIILVFWVCSGAFSFIFKSIFNIMSRKQERDIINKLKEVKDGEHKRKT